MKSFLSGRNKYYDVVLSSSFLYLICAMIINGQDIVMTSFLFLIFLTSLFYHSYPKNIFFRLADWVATLGFIYYLLNIIYNSYLNYATFLPLFLLLFLLAIISLLTSLIAYREKSLIIYNLSHSL